MGEAQQDSQNLLPSNLEAEQAVLGSLLSDSGLTYWPQVAGLLIPDHFAEPVHSRIFNAVATLCSAGKGCAEPRH